MKKKYILLKLYIGKKEKKKETVPICPIHCVLSTHKIFWSNLEPCRSLKFNYITWTLSRKSFFLEKSIKLLENK